MSTDEKTGIQALERKHPDIPMGPGRVQRREHEYIRHGTLCLTANLEIWCGCIIAPTLGPTRTEGDFATHIEQTVATDPFAGNPDIRRNDPCPCGSGQKYKHCHGAY